MKYIISISILLLSIHLSHAQNVYDRVLTEIEQNNGSLRALHKQADALKVENMSGIYFENPEIEYNYLWGKPEHIGNRQDLSISQGFDLSTLLGRRKSLAKSKNELVELEYHTERVQVLQSAKENIITVIYYNNLLSELQTRNQHAEEISALYERRLRLGDATILEYNKSQINLANLKGQILEMETERERILAELKRLNGGKEVEINDVDYPLDNLPSDFETWYKSVIEQSPTLRALEQEIAVNAKNISLQKSANLPSFRTGFMREKVMEEDFKGITLGISVPLWQNKNKVKHARLEKIASEERLVDFQAQAYTYLKSLYKNAQSYQETIKVYQGSIDSNNNNRLLKKALEAGEITLLEYTMEQSIYYENFLKSVEAQQNYQIALAKLQEYTL